MTAKGEGKKDTSGGGRRQEGGCDGGPHRDPTAAVAGHLGGVESDDAMGQLVAGEGIKPNGTKKLMAIVVQPNAATKKVALEKLVGEWGQTGESGVLEEFIFESSNGSFSWFLCPRT